MPAQWSWILADSQGSNLCELATASGRSLSFKRNLYSEAQLTVSHDDDAAYLLLNTLTNTGIPTLKCYRRRADESTATLRFRGYLAGLQESSEETSLLTATFRSPFGRLLGDGDRTGRFSQARWFTGIFGGGIAEQLVNTANQDNPTGLRIPPVSPPTKPRDRTYPFGTNVGQAVINLTNVLDGFDFYESFVEDIGDVMADFKVVPSLGLDRPEVKFEYGPTTLANVRGMTRTISPPENVILATGANGLSTLYFAPTGNGLFPYGQWWTRVDLPDVSEQATLDDKAKELARPYPIKTVSFMPELGLSNCPRPFDDFDLGDTVSFLARRGALYENTKLRVNGFTVAVDENGIETTEVEDPTMPEEDAMIRARLTAEVV